MLEAGCYPLLIDGNRGTVRLWDLSRVIAVSEQSASARLEVLVSYQLGLGVLK